MGFDDDNFEGSRTLGDRAWSRFTTDIECRDSTVDNCSRPLMLEAQISVFHDQVLKDASAEIRKIIEMVGKERDGRHLAFVNTRMGTLLAWVQHTNAPLKPEAVTANSDNATIAKALGLINW